MYGFRHWDRFKVEYQSKRLIIIDNFLMARELQWTDMYG